MNTIVGDLLDIKGGILAQVVNNRRVMGAGLAKQIALKWPKVKQAYILEDNTLGECRVVWIKLNPARVITYPFSDKGLGIANLYAQDGLNLTGEGRHWKRRLHYGHLVTCLTHLQFLHYAEGLPIYIPYQMGCGLAGGDWGTVLELIQVFVPEATIVKLPQAKQ